MNQVPAAVSRCSGESTFGIVSDHGGLGIVSDGIVSDLFEYRIVSDFWYRLFFDKGGCGPGPGPAQGPWAHELVAYGVSSIRGFKHMCFLVFNIEYFILDSFKPRNVPATFFRLFFGIFTFFQGPEKEPERPYDQNDGSFAPRSLI